MVWKRVLVSHSGGSEMSRHDKSYGEKLRPLANTQLGELTSKQIFSDVSVQVTAALANILLHLHERSWTTPLS